MLTAPLHSPFPDLSGRLRIIVCSYRGGIGNPPPFSVAGTVHSLGRLGRIIDALLLLNLRQFIASNRDFSANPRNLAYQVGMIEELLRSTRPAEVTIALDQALAADAARSALEAIGRVEVCDPRDLLRGAREGDAIVIVYPDALGLGWGGLEAGLAGARTYMLNGRRRIRRLDAGVRGRLRWRRLLAVTRIPELVASLAILPVAAALAAWDAMHGKS